MRSFLVILLLSSLTCAAQNKTPQPLIYFNEEFKPCTKEEAFYAGITNNKDDETDVILYHSNGKRAFTGGYTDKTLQTRNGTFTWFDTNGVRTATIIYKNNQKNGMYLVWYSNKVLRDSGSFVNDVPDGLWKSWYADGQLKMSCSYSAKKFIALKKELTNPKALSDIKALLPPPELEKLSNPGNTDKYSVHIFFPFYFHFKESGSINEKNISATDEAEKNISFPGNNNNLLSSLCIRNDITDPCLAMIDGSYEYYFPNGLPMISGSFKNGMKKGLWEKWTSNGKRKSVGIYHNNHEAGEWKYYDGEGELTVVKRFGKDGLLTNQMEIK